MATDRSIRVDARFWSCWMSAGRLKELLVSVPDDAVVWPNRSGNLVISRGGAATRPADNDRKIGHIDFDREKLILKEDKG